MVLPLATSTTRRAGCGACHRRRYRGVGLPVGEPPRAKAAGGPRAGGGAAAAERRRRRRRLGGRHCGGVCDAVCVWLTVSVFASVDERPRPRRSALLSAPGPPHPPPPPFPSAALPTAATPPAAAGGDRCGPTRRPAGPLRTAPAHDLRPPPLPQFPGWRVSPHACSILGRFQMARTPPQPSVTHHPISLSRTTPSLHHAPPRAWQTADKSKKKNRPQADSTVRAGGVAPAYVYSNPLSRHPPPWPTIHKDTAHPAAGQHATCIVGSTRRLLPPLSLRPPPSPPTPPALRPWRLSMVVLPLYHPPPQPKPPYPPPQPGPPQP